MLSLRDRYRGMILGTATGDSLGLPAEGISRARARKLFKGRWHQGFVLGRGMISDDTEHTFFVVQSLLAHSTDVDLFAKRLGWCFRWWFASLPAGVGLATARASIKLWLGVGAHKSGVNSAGNGASMRVAPIGAFFYADPEKMNTFVRASTHITHTDPRALIGARAIAVTAAWIVRDNLSVRPPAGAFCNLLKDVALERVDWTSIVETMESSFATNATVDDFAESLGMQNGVSGFVYHTVPIALYAWHRHFGDYAAGMTAVLNCGGDTDTTGAIAGALAGLTVGESGIPPDWLNGIVEWPRSIKLMRCAADRLAELKESGKTTGIVRYFWPGIVIRNAIFLLIVLVHGLRRLLPPY